MQTDQFYYLTTLPALGELGSTPSMGLADLVEHVRDHKQWSKLLGVLVLLDDLQQREAFLAGELDEVEPSVLTVGQARNEAPLPEELFKDQEPPEVTIETDMLWADYFRYADRVARQHGSAFLKKWIAFEVALRNTLAAARAKRLGIDEAGYLVASELADTDEDFSEALAEWESAPTPLAGLHAVVRARWEWLRRHEVWFTFSADELLVYAARIMLLEQWRRSADQDEPTGA